MLKIFLIITGIAALGYWQRYGFRRSWYVLRTGDLHPDFESMDADYFLGRKAEQPERTTSREQEIS